MYEITFNRFQLRRTTFVTLPVRVPPLMSGVVNACLPEPHSQTFVAVSAAASSSKFAHGGLIKSALPRVKHGHYASLPVPQGEFDAGWEGCLKICADESSPRAKEKFTQADLPNPAVVDVVRWLSFAPLPTGTRRRRAERLASPKPPLVFRFVDLTI